MTRNEHEQAREWIVLADGLTDIQRDFLQAHLAGCADCREFAEGVAKVVGGLRSVPIAADSRLVRATQMRVRFHAGRLREMRQRSWLVGMTCLGVGLSATLTAPVLWRIFAWMGEWAGVSTIVWQMGFVSFFVVPALVVSVLLLVKGTVLTSHGDRLRQ